jgi:nucleotide-binding universal stress UspA family protein
MVTTTHKQHTTDRTVTQTTTPPSTETSKPRLKTVLVSLDSIPKPKDSAAFSHEVLASLQHLNLMPDSHIILSHVIPIDLFTVDIKSDRPFVETHEIQEQALADLQQLQANLPCASSVEVLQGDPAEEILRLANIHHADLIVMGCRGLTGVERILSRSVSGQVVEEASCSVWVVKPIA